MMAMLTRRFLIVGAFLVAGLLQSGSYQAARAQEVAAAATSSANFVQSLGDQAIAVIADPKKTDESALQAFRQLLNTNFDITTIARFVLGRHWNSANPAQQAEYMQLFERMIVETYAQRFNQYAGESFKVIGSREEGKRDEIVTSQVIRLDGPPVNVAWRVRKQGDGYKIIDVIVENVSMTVTQRSEFASVIDQNGGRVDSLLEVLRQRIQSTKAG